MDNNLSNLIVNLGTRSGDPSLWWFLVNHYVEIKESSTKECTWNSGELNQIICNMPDELDVSQAKHSLKEFYLNHSDKLLVTDAELIDLNFLKNQKINDSKAETYISAVEVVSEFNKSLNSKLSPSGLVDKYEFTADDINHMDFISKLPLYIKLAAMRRIIGIDKIIGFDLDNIC